MAHDGCICDVQGVEKIIGVESELFERKLVTGGFRRFAESHLIWNNNAIASGEEDVYRGVPGAATEVFPVEENDVSD